MSFRKEQYDALRSQIGTLKRGQLPPDACSNAALARKLEALEKKYDAQFKVVFDAIRQLMTPPEPKRHKIGFLAKERAAKYGIVGRPRA